MKYITANKKIKKKYVIPGFNITLGITLSMLSLLVIIPLASIIIYAFNLSFGEFIEIIFSENVLNAFVISIGCSAAAALINTVFGLITAWVLVRYNFFGKKIIDGLIDLPFAMPTAVAGITLSRIYSTKGIIGENLSNFNIKISYTHIGIVIAMVFVGIPFVIRSIQPVLEKLDPQYEEAAYILGANKRRTFFNVILPELKPSLFTGFALAFARGVGEYGSVIYISGNSVKNHTQVISYIIMQKLNYIDYVGAASVALVLLVISFIILFLINIVQYRQIIRTNNV